MRHPLLLSLGRDTRELQRALSTAAIATDDELPTPPLPDTLLGRLQSDLAADLPRPDGRVLAVGDRSVQVHACHGVARQVDVLREVLLGLLDDDPTLEPRDVLVMCPDIETYAPLIEAGFGLGDVVGSTGHPAHRLRVRLADRAPGQTNPLLGVATALLDLAGGRAQATQVLDLARAEPVRRRFGFSDDDLDQLDTWARESGVRWAFDADHRADFGLEALRREHLGVRARPAAHRRRPVRRLRRPGSTGPSRSTTSAARRSTWSGGSPSTSTGCATRPTGSPAPARSTTGSGPSTTPSPR